MITFNIPTSSHTIELTQALPNITVPLTIYGTSQPGVTIDGMNAIADGLVLASGSSGSDIVGLTLTGFTDAAILIDSSNDTIRPPSPGRAILSPATIWTA